MATVEEQAQRQGLPEETLRQEVEAQNPGLTPEELAEIPNLAVSFDVQQLVQPSFTTRSAVINNGPDGAVLTVNLDNTTVQVVARDGTAQIITPTTEPPTGGELPPNATLTPATDLVFAGDLPTVIIFGRQGNDTLYGFVPPSTPTTPQLDLDIFIGDSELNPDSVIEDFVNTLIGNPTPGGADRFILGDRNTSFFSNNLNQDVGLILNYNRNEDIIQLNGAPEDYRFISIPLLGTFIYKLSPTSPFFFNGDLIGIVAGVSNFRANDPTVQYVGNTAPIGPVEPEVRQLRTASIDVASSPATDAQGNVYVTGITGGSLEGSNAGSYDIWIAKYNSNGEQLFINQFGSSASDEVQDITTDNFGNFYIAGGTSGEIVQAPVAGLDALLAKFDSNGNQIFAVQFIASETLPNGGINGIPSLNTATDVTVDSQGNAYVSGLTVAVDTIPQGGLDPQGDFWVAKYDASGNQVWYTSVSSEVRADEGLAPWEEAYSVTLSPDGSAVYATGWTTGDLPGDAVEGFYDAWLTKFDSQTGEIEFIQQFGTGRDEFGWSVDTDSQGNIYSYGWITTIGEDAEVEVEGFGDLFLAKFSPDGTEQFFNLISTPGDDAAFIGGLVIDASDTIYVSGYSESSFTDTTNAGSYDAFVIALDTEGNQIWRQQFGTPQLDFATDINVDNFGNIYVTGVTEGSLGDVNEGAVDGWVAKLDTATGELLSLNPNLPNQINGTRNPDNLSGTQTRDVISGNNGDDTINGGAGSDTIEGGRGGDIISGGSGNDILAADRVNRFDDFDGTTSQLNGDDGNDTIYGGAKGDIVDGGNNNDFLFGQNGNDTISGGNGNDRLNGGVGDDQLDGGEGVDTADYSDLVFNGVFGTVPRLDINLATGQAQHSSTNNALTWTDTVSSIENVIGTSGNDRFIGDGNDNVFDGQGQVGRSDRQTTFTDVDGDVYQVIADVVEYSGNQSEFTVEGSVDNFTVAGVGIGTDTLINIEFLKFNDGVVTVTDSLFA
jgi:Ca2+-binding RTX toxin-like protein